MNAQHFLKKGDNDNEEVYQIFDFNLSTKISIDDNEKAEEERADAEADNESRFCYIVLDCDSDCKINMEEKGKVRKEIKEIKVNYFQLARISKKFQKMKQFCNFPFIKRFKLDIKSIKEDTFLEFIKSTQGEEFKITETNYFDLYHLSKEWGTYELTNILQDYGIRHESNIRYIIEQYLYLTKEYDHQKEENIGKQNFNRREKDNKTEEDSNNNKDKEEHKNIFKNIFKNKFREIKKIEEIMKNRIEECFKIDIFWGIKIGTIHRLIKENSKQNYSHDLLLECIIESIEERKYLIELIDPWLISEGNHQKLVDLQYKLVKEWKNHKQGNQQHNNHNNHDNHNNHNNYYVNMNLIFELLQSFQEPDYNDNNKFPNKFISEELNKLKRGLEEREKDNGLKGKEIKELREREMNFCNEIIEIKENIKKEKKEVKRKKKEILMKEKEFVRNQKEEKKKKKENRTREEENKQNDEKIEKRRKEVEIKEKEIQEREEKVDKGKNIIENKEKEIIKNKKENEMKKEEIQNQEKNIIQREKMIEENKYILEKEKIIFEKKMKDEEEKMREKEKQQQKLIDELQNQMNQNDAEMTRLKTMELDTFLKENNYLNSIDDRDGYGNEAIHIACKNGNDKIVSYILSRNPSKLNVKNVSFFVLCLIIGYIYGYFYHLINSFSSNNLYV